MADWKDILEGISGGFMGVTKGLTAGAEPFNAWENVRTKDIANDKGEIQLRDLQLMQDALEAEGLGYYGNAATAKDALNRKSTSASNADIFGNENKLALQQYLSDPNGAFQQGIKETGWTPGSPEYRAWLAEAISQFDPTAGVKGYDSFGVEKIQNRNLNEQAALSYIEGYVKQKDPNAVVVRNEDGTVDIIGSDGQVTHGGDLLTKVAAMIQAPTPLDAVDKGLRLQIAIETANAKIAKDLNEGRITPAQGLKALDQQRIAISQEYNKAVQELVALQKSQEYILADDATKLEMVTPIKQRAESARNQLDKLKIIYQTVAATGRLPGASMPGAPRVAPTGTSSVTAPRPPPGAAAARAAGEAASAGAPWGESAAGAPPYPRRAVSPQDTGVRPITQGAPDDPMLQFLQLIGAV